MKSPLNFRWSDASKHGGGGNTFGKAPKTTTDADRAGWEKSDETGGFSYPAPRRGFLRGRR
jgi:hypothetical protein